MNRDALITGAQAARLAGVSRQLFRRWWVDLGHLQPAGHYTNGPLFRVRDVLAAERATRNSPLSSRNPKRVA